MRELKHTPQATLVKKHEEKKVGTGMKTVLPEAV